MVHPAGPEVMVEQGHAELELRVRDDAEAFARLFELNYPRIFNFVVHSTGDVQASMDLTSETFLKALRAVDRYDHRRAPLTSWLYGIASKEIAMYYRKPDNGEAPDAG